MFENSETKATYDNNLKKKSIFITISKMKKRYTNFGQEYIRGGEIGKIIETGTGMHIYS